MDAIVGSVLGIAMLCSHEHELDVEGQGPQSPCEAMLGACEGADLCHVAILSFGGRGAIGVTSAGVGTPLEAAGALLVGPDGQRAADDRTARQRAEVPAVHAVRRI